MSSLFLIGINDITSNLKPPIKAHLFADDITIIWSGKNVHFINEYLQTTINTLQDWSNITGLHFSPHKIQNIQFTLEKNILQFPPKLHLKNIEIKFAQSIKLLILIFDEKLSSYLKSLNNFCMNRPNIIKIFSNKNWDTDQETYRALIRSKLDYGCTVYNLARNHIKKNSGINQYRTRRQRNDPRIQKKVPKFNRLRWQRNCLTHRCPCQNGTM